MESPPQRRLSDSFGSLSDADTVDQLSQDSASTLSPTPARSDEAPSQFAHAPNASEELVRRRAQHSPASMPELRRADDWQPEVARVATSTPPPRREKRVQSPSLVADDGAAAVWAAAHPENITVFVRWRLQPLSATSPNSATTSGERCCGSQWVPYTVPLAAVFPALCGGDEANTAGNTMQTCSTGPDSVPVSTRRGRATGSAQLLLGRSALIADMMPDAINSTSTVPAAVNTEDVRELLRDAAASVSRAHCNVHVNFYAHRTKSTPASADDLTRASCISDGEHNAAPATLHPRCHSFDVYALSLATVINGVPVQPHFRYHFQADDAWCCPNGVLTLRLGYQCSVDLALGGLVKPAGEAATSLRGRVSGSLALHRPAQRAQPPPPSDGLLGRDRSDLALARGSTTSLFTADSTTVLASLSNLSEPVALSDHDSETYHNEEDPAIDGGARGQTIQDGGDGAAALLDQVENEVVPQLAKRRVAATKTTTKKTATATTKTTTQRARRGAAAAAAPSKEDLDDSSSDDDETVVPPDPPSEVVLFTTGVRLSDQEEEDLKSLGALLNPPLRFACYAKLLIAQKPLMRSVKLLTVLPYVREIVQQSWLDTALHTHTLDIPTESFAYTERRMPDSIETQNSFDLRETLDKPPENRQKLLSGQRFWVHRTAAPQDPPINDLKTVLVASGGVVTRHVEDANVFVMPQQRPALKCWKSLLEELGGVHVLSQRRNDGLLLVVPDDIFKCVLQQRPLMHSTVIIPHAQLSNGSSGSASAGRTKRNTRSSKGTGSGSSNKRARSSGGGGSGRLSQTAKKSQRPSSSQRSPRSSKRRRST